MINFLADDYDGCGGDGGEDDNNDAAPQSSLRTAKRAKQKWEAWLI